MGNYFANTSFKDNGCINHNNNFTMTNFLKRTSFAESNTPTSAKLSKLGKIIEISTEISVQDTFQNYYKEHNFGSVWNKFSYIIPSSFVKTAPHCSEVGVKTKLGKTEETTIKKNSTRSQCLNQYFSPKCESPKSQVQTINQYLTSYKPREQIDLFLTYTAVVNMVDLLQPRASMHLKEMSQQCPSYQTFDKADQAQERTTRNSSFADFETTNEDLEITRYPKGVSFFIDINEAEIRQPLAKVHKFDFYDYSDTSSMCSFDDDCCDDFIIFEKQKCEYENKCCRDFIFEHQECENENKHFEVNTSITNLRETNMTMSCIKIVENPSNSTKLVQVDNLFHGFPSNCEEASTSCEILENHVVNSKKNDNMSGFRYSLSKNCGEFSKVSRRPSKDHKKVRFKADDNLVAVHHMRHWDFAYRNARKGPWELAAVDRDRFCCRIRELAKIINPCLEKKLEVMEKL